MSWTLDELRRPDGSWKVSDAELASLGGPETRLGDLVWLMHKYQAAALELASGSPPVALLQGNRIPIGQEALTPAGALKIVMLALRPEPKRCRLLEQGSVEEVVEHPMGSYRVQARVAASAGVQVRVEPASQSSIAPPPLSEPLPARLPMPVAHVAAVAAPVAKRPPSGEAPPARPPSSEGPRPERDGHWQAAPSGPEAGLRWQSVDAAEAWGPPTGVPTWEAPPPDRQPSGEGPAPGREPSAPAQDRGPSDDRPAPDRQPSGDRPAPDRQPSGEKPAPDRQPSGERPAPDRQPSGERPAPDRQPSGEKPAPDRRPSGEGPPPGRPSGEKTAPEPPAEAPYTGPPVLGKRPTAPPPSSAPPPPPAAARLPAVEEPPAAEQAPAPEPVPEGPPPAPPMEATPLPSFIPQAPRGAQRPEPYLLLGSLNGAYQAALFPDSCLFFREGVQFFKCPLPGLPLVGTRPYLDDNATLHFRSSTGLLVVNQKGERRIQAGSGRVEVRLDGEQWIYCDETETRGLLGGASKLFQMTLATEKSKLVYFETRSKPEWAVSPKFEHLLVGEPRRGKLALHLILVAEESVVGEFELAKPRDMQVDDGGLMLLEFGDSSSPEWVLCRSQGGKLQSAQWKPPPGTRRGWPTKSGAMAVTDTQVIRLGLQGQGMQQVRVADRTVSKLWDVVPSLGPQGAQLLVWESGRLLLLPLWDAPGPLKPALPLEELLTHMSQINCRGAWLEPGRKCMLDSGQTWGDAVLTEGDLRGWVEQARRYAGSTQSNSFRRRALNHEYTVSVVDQPRPGLRVQRAEAGPESM